MVETNSIQVAQTRVNTSINTSFRIVLVDDQKFVLHKVKQMLLPQANLEIVGTANNGIDAIACVETLNPDAVLIDIEMPEMDGIETTRILSQRFPGCKVLVLSSYENQEYIQKAILAGADGYVQKSITAEDLGIAIGSVCKGYSYFDSQLLKKIQPATDYYPQQANLITAKPDSDKYQNQLDLPQNLSPGQTEEFLPPIGKWVTWGGIFVFTILTLAFPVTTLLKYKTVVKTQASVRPKGELNLVQAAVDGKILQILVEQGEQVKQGEVIAKINPSRFQTKQKQIAKGIKQQKYQLTQLNAQIANLETQIAAETERNLSEVDAAKAELIGNKRNYQDKNIEVTTGVEEAEAQVKAVEATLKAAIAKYKRYKSVASRGAIGKDHLAEAKLDYQRQEQELKTAQAKLDYAVNVLNPSSAEVKIAEQRIQQAEQSGQATIAALNREKEALRQQRMEIQKLLEQDRVELKQLIKDLQETKITASTEGTVFKLGLRNSGQTVQPGQEIAQIIPKNSNLEIKAAVTTSDIDKLEIGQKVQMRVSACPYPDYGTLPGKVSHIAKDTSKPEKTDNNPTTPPTQPFYEVAIAPKSLSLGKDSNQCTLQLGMEGKADIVTREETVLRFLLRKARIITDL